MKEYLLKIKKMIEKDEKEKAIKYIDSILANKDASDYIDDLVENLK